MQEAEVVGTLLGHNGRVDCVKWLPLSPAGVNDTLSVDGTFSVLGMETSAGDAHGLVPCRECQGPGFRSSR